MIIGGLIILGGIQRIAAVAEKVVPFMAIAYIVGCLAVFFMHIDMVGDIFTSIFKFFLKEKPVLVDILFSFEKATSWFKIIGLLGLFLGPIILIILKNIFSTMIDDGIIKTILVLQLD